MSQQWPEKVIFCEVGPRDGLQNEPSTLSVERKTALNRGRGGCRNKNHRDRLLRPPEGSSPDGRYRRSGPDVPPDSGVEYRALVANLKGVERALASGITKVKLTVSASESHAKANLNKTPRELIEGFKECTAFARANGAEVSGAISTAFGCPFEGKVPPSQVREIAGRMHDLGLTELSLSDTTGMANPRQVFDLSSMMMKEFPAVRWFLHFHNTRGMALANIVAGMQAGVIRFDGSLAGLGGCPYAPGASGNISSEDMIHMFSEMGIETGIDLGKIITLAGQLRDWVGHADSAVLKAGTCADLVPLTAAKKQR